MDFIKHYYDIADRNKLCVEINDKAINLKFPIDQSIQIGDVLIVLIFDPDAKETPIANVFAFSKSGDRLWTIQESQSRRPYGDIWIEDSKLLAGDQLGVDYFVSLNDGSIEFARVSK